MNEPASTTTQTVLIADDKIDPLRAELRRCRSIGQAAASDTLCLRAWAEQRSRFFMGVQQATRSDFGDAEPAASATIDGGAAVNSDAAAPSRSEEHATELQSL